jgi:hypothetical protein
VDLQGGFCFELAGLQSRRKPRQPTRASAPGRTSPGPPRPKTTLTPMNGILYSLKSRKPQGINNLWLTNRTNTLPITHLNGILYKNRGEGGTPAGVLGRLESGGGTLGGGVEKTKAPLARGFDHPELKAAIGRSAIRSAGDQCFPARLASFSSATRVTALASSYLA